MGRRKHPRVVTETAPENDVIVGPPDTMATVTISMQTAGGLFQKTFFFSALRLEHEPEYDNLDVTTYGDSRRRFMPSPTGGIKLTLTGRVVGEA